MILITGATGYVGSAMLPHILATSEPVRALVRSEKSVSRVRTAGAESVIGSVTDRASLDKAMQGVDTVIHLVAVNKNKGQQTMTAINHQGTINVVDAAKKAGVRRFIHMSGCGLRSDMSQEFARTKGQGSDYVKASGLDYTIIGPSVIYGEGDEFVNNLADLFKLWIYPVAPVVGNGKTRFAPIWKEDVARVFVKCLQDPQTIGQYYEIGGPENIEYKQMMQIIKDKLGSRKPMLNVPIWMIKPGVVVMNAVLSKPPVTPGLLDLLAIDNTPQPNAITSVFGIYPKPIREGIDYVVKKAAKHG